MPVTGPFVHRGGQAHAGATRPDKLAAAVVPGRLREAVGAGAATFLIAVAVNYPWELAQSSLYETGGSLRAMLWPCFVASLGDGGLVVFMWIVGWAAVRRVDWFVHPGIGGYALMLGTGFAIAAGVEWAALGSGRWAYTEAMPRVPGLGAGLVPIAQMLVLPPLVFRIVRFWLYRSTG